MKGVLDTAVLRLALSRERSASGRRDSARRPPGPRRVLQRRLLMQPYRMRADLDFSGKIRDCGQGYGS